MKTKLIMFDDNDTVRTWDPSNPNEIGSAFRSHKRQYFASPENRVIVRKTRLKFFERFETWLFFHVRSVVAPDLSNGDPATGWINKVPLGTLQETFGQICSDRFQSILPKQDEDPDADASGGKRKWIPPICAGLAFIYCIIGIAVGGGS